MAELELNELLNKLENPESAVKYAEEKYGNEILGVAGRIAENPEIKVILLAGPSGSGKTTTANLLCDKIISMGRSCMVVSMDNFYKELGDPTYPMLAEGGRDFESPLSLKVDALNETIGNIILAKPFTVPKYDFKIGGVSEVVSYGGNADGCVIIEGIHGLNPMFSEGFSHGSVMKIFVSVSTNINVDGVRIISGKKLRFVRRLVRDSIYRATDADGTLRMWKNVLMGEEKYLYPYKNDADIKLDTFHIFEPAVMKPYALELLMGGVAQRSPYADVVCRGLANIPEYPSDIVPQTSLIREFIPGGIYEHLY